MNHHAYFAGARRVETAILGTGGFGCSFLARGRKIPLVGVVNEAIGEPEAGPATRR